MKKKTLRKRIEFLEDELDGRVAQLRAKETAEKNLREARAKHNKMTEVLKTRFDSGLLIADMEEEVERQAIPAPALSSLFETYVDVGYRHTITLHLIRESS